MKSFIQSTCHLERTPSSTVFLEHQEFASTTVFLNFASPIYRGGGIRPVLADDGGVAVRAWRPLRLSQHKNKGVLLEPPPLLRRGGKGRGVL